MKILISILLNASILFILAYFLGANEELGLKNGITVTPTGIDAWKTYLIGGAILGVINVTLKPILKILTLPLFFVFLGLVVFIVNGIVLKTLEYVMQNILVIDGVNYQINGIENFVIAVAIFTILNMFYSIIFFKK